MRSRALCPACKWINPDDWTICVKCGAAAPVRKIAIPKDRKISYRRGQLFQADLEHLIWCLHQVTVHNLYKPLTKSYLFWQRHARISKFIKKSLEERKVRRDEQQHKRSKQ